MNEIVNIQNIYQLIAFVVLSFFTVALPLLLKAQKTQKERKNIDEIQTKKIETLAKKVDEIGENIKDIRLVSQIEAELNAMVLKIISVREIENKEIADAIRFGIARLIEGVRIIVFMNFQLTDREIRELMLYYLRKTKYNINLKNLQINDFSEFIDISEAKIKERIAEFVLKFSTIKLMKNGERQQAFKTEIIYLASDIISVIIYEFNIRRKNG